MADPSTPITAAAVNDTTPPLSSMRPAELQQLPGMGSPSPSSSLFTAPPPAATGGLSASPTAQRTREALAEASARHIASLRHNAALADLYLQMEGEESPSQRFAVHRCVLAAGSPTFAAMFDSGMLESVVGATVTVPYSRRTLDCLLSFLYCDTERCASLIDYPTAMELLDACCYYQLDVLKEAAVSTARDCTTPSTVLDVLTAAIRFGSDRLRDHCIGFMRQHNTDVLGAAAWVHLPLDVAVLVIRETVIESESRLLDSCIEWCRARAAAQNLPDEDATRARITELLADFLPYINFTAMRNTEIEHVERQGYVPLDVLYRAFKAKALGEAPTWSPRHGGILLQWEMTGSLRVSNNHVVKTANDFGPRLITAMNRFSAGCHYWTVNIVDLRTKHDCIVGVRAKPRAVAAAVATFARPTVVPAAAPDGSDLEITYEPCCNTVTAIPSSSLRVVKAACCPETIMGPDHCGVVGIMVDFDRACVRFYDHAAKALLYTVEAIAPTSGDNDGEGEGESASSVSAPAADVVSAGTLPAPLFPCATLYHRGNGGVVLGDTTTYLGEAPRVITASALQAAIATPGSNDASPNSNQGTPKRSIVPVFGRR